MVAAGVGWRQPKGETVGHRGKLVAGALAAGLLLSGCIVMQAYKPPLGDTTADIVFVNESSAPMSMFIYGDAARCTERTLLNRRPIDARARAATTIVTGRKVAFSMFQGAGGSMYCEVTFDFTPQPGRHYIFAGRPNGKICNYALLESSEPIPAGGRIPWAKAAPVKLNERLYRTGFDEHGPFCEADF